MADDLAATTGTGQMAFPGLEADAESAELLDLVASSDPAVTTSDRPFPTYAGSKDATGVSERIAGLIPRQALYVEPFLGNGAVMRRKLPALHSVGIDADPRVIAAWRRFNYPGLELIEGDGIGWLERFGDELPEDAVVYCDPPYPLVCRRHRRIYRCELTDDDHRRLLAVVNALPCVVLVSSYWSVMYGEALGGWEHETISTMSRGGPRTEHLWHRGSRLATFGVDGHFIGRNFRERERIKRKVARWVAKLEGMPTAERRAILEALIAAYGDVGREWTNQTGKSPKSSGS